MRYYLLILPLFFVSIGSYSQEKACPFEINSSVFVDSVTSLRLLDTLKALPFKTYNRKGKMPRFIKRALQCTEGEFRIANPGHPYNVSDAIGPFGWLFPFRQLMYLGRADHYLLMAYKMGGRGTGTIAMLIKFDHQQILNMWCWLGVSEDTKSKEHILLSLQYYGEIPKRRFAL
jgi:hypothetical protein